MYIVYSLSSKLAHEHIKTCHYMVEKTWKVAISIASHLFTWADFFINLIKTSERKREPKTRMQLSFVCFAIDYYHCFRCKTQHSVRAIVNCLFRSLSLSQIHWLHMCNSNNPCHYRWAPHFRHAWIARKTGNCDCGTRSYVTPPVDHDPLSRLMIVSYNYCIG